MTLTGRIGQFIFFMGLLSMIIFIVTDQAGTPRYLYFFVGVILIFFGLFLMWTHRNPPEPSERFRTMRKLRENRVKKRESIEEEKFSQTERRSKKS